jgi:hypothetical protein
VTFAKGAALEDPAGVFNNGFNGNTMRAIDMREGHELDRRRSSRSFAKQWN